MSDPLLVQAVHILVCKWLYFLFRIILKWLQILFLRSTNSLAHSSIASCRNTLNVDLIRTPLIIVCSEMIKDGGSCCWLWKGSQCWNNNWCWAEAELRHCHRLTPITLFSAAHFAGSRQIKTQKGSGFWKRCLQVRQWWIALDVCSESGEIGLWRRAIALGHMHPCWL